MRWFLVLAIVLSAVAQQTPADKPHHVEVATIEPRAEDVGTIDGIMKAYYEVISGPAGQPRQWSRDRTLYIPDIRFVPMSEDKSGKPRAQIVSHQQFVDASNPMLVKEGFYESEIHRATERFGNIAHVFSTYESRQKADGPVIARGINSVELFWDGKRWWIASAIWDDERPDNPIPAEYLPTKDAESRIYSNVEFVDEGAGDLIGIEMQLKVRGSEADGSVKVYQGSCATPDSFRGTLAGSRLQVNGESTVYGKFTIEGTLTDSDFVGDLNLENGAKPEKIRLKPIAKPHC